MTSHALHRRLAVAACLFAFLSVRPSFGGDSGLFDRFSITAGASSLALDTKVRLDLVGLEIGTEIDLERDLGLDSSSVTPTVSMSWSPSDRHQLLFQYLRADRDASAQVSRTLRFGDLVIPIDAVAAAAVDLREIRGGYTFYPWVRERWAAGFGLGVRFIDVAVEVRLTDAPAGVPIVREKAEAAGPLPFVRFDARYAPNSRWRLLGSAGWLSLKVGDFDGGQLLGSLGVEFLPFEHFGVGLTGSLATVDVDVSDPDYRGRLQTDIGSLGLFVKSRW